jgi:sugar O-acyltransferase (sialic acid O-acetyltransferase NeuD family)
MLWKLRTPMTLYGLYGIGGCARSVMPIVRAMGLNGEAVFVDDATDAPPEVNGTPVISFGAFTKRSGPKAINVAIANSRVRQRLVERCSAAGIDIFTVRDRTSIEMDAVALGEGAILSPFTVLTSNIRIGRHFHANLYSYVEHDCVIGDYVTFGPGAKCNGNVEVGDHAYIGAGATIRHGRPGAPLRIGAGAVIGMGAVVTRDVPHGETWVGNPARRIVGRSPRSETSPVRK